MDDELWASDEEDRQKSLLDDPEYLDPVKVLRRRKRRYKEALDDTREDYHEKETLSRNTDYSYLILFLFVWSLVMWALMKYSPWGHHIYNNLIPILGMVSIPLVGVMVMYWLETSPTALK
jgi:hypothetical protein